MYCEKCGTKLDEKTKKCKNCEELLEKIEEEKEEAEDKTVIFTNDDNGLNVFSMIAFIFAFLLFPVGFVLSIIGIVKCNKYKKEHNKKITYAAFNYAGLFISSIFMFFILVMLVIMIFVAGLVKGKDKDALGEYTCYLSQYSQIPVVTASFKDKRFVWAKYGDEKNNVLMGKYTVNSRGFNNDTFEYTLTLTPDYYEADNKLDLNKTYNITITGKDKSANVKFSNGRTYYCDKVGD